MSGTYIYTQQHVGRKLAEARHIAGLTQAEAAARTGCSKQSITLWEHGKNSIAASTLAKLMSVYAEEFPEYVETPSLDDILGFRPARVSAGDIEVSATARDEMACELAAMPRPEDFDEVIA